MTSTSFLEIIDVNIEFTLAPLTMNISFSDGLMTGFIALLTSSVKSSQWNGDNDRPYVI